MKAIKHLIRTLFFILFLSVFSCGPANNEFKTIPFDFINNSSEGCHMYFYWDGMNFNNYVDPNSFITRYYECGFFLTGETPGGHGDRLEDQVEIAVGRNQKKLKEITVIVDYSVDRIFVEWDGKTLSWRD